MPKTLPAQPAKIPSQRGRPKRQVPYLLPSLPSKKPSRTTRQRVEQKSRRAVLQNNAASLRYRRRQTLKQQQQEIQTKQVFQRNAKLLARQAKLKQALEAMSKRVCQQAEKGCGECLQTSLLLCPASSSQQPMVKIEALCMEDWDEQKLQSQFEQN